MSKLILVRHGQSLWNSQNKFTGWVDVDLSDKGVNEAKKSAQLIKESKINLDLFYTSYLKRAINTLEIILQVLDQKNKNYLKAWQLNERHYGSLTGMNKDEMKKKLGEEEFIKYRRSWNISPPPIDKSNINHSLFGKLNNSIPKQFVPLSESLKDTFDRIVPFYINKIEKNLKNNKNILISAHGNSLRALCKSLLNISDDKINELEIPTGNPLLLSFNENFQVNNFEYLDKTRKKEILFNQ